MKKLTISTITLLSVGLAALGATNAYFSDTETSTGNVFVAGAIDLKVDHTLSTYNDLICDDNEWAPVCTNVGGNLVQNGGFENPTVTSVTGRQLFPTGTAGLVWTIQRRTTGAPESIELHKSYNGYLPSELLQHAELDANVSTRIWQDIPTVPGKTYTLRFAFSPRPGELASENRLQAEWGGVNSGSFGPIAGGVQTTWTYHTITLTATATVTRLGFADIGTSNGQGTLLDDVTLYELSCPDSPLIGTECETWGETDLLTERFFNFGDVKPGDHGRDVISIHVYDNDAHACLFLTDIEDNENTNVIPEQLAGDVSVPDGELEETMQFFFWKDLDGDGFYEPSDGEEALVDDALFNLETIPLFDSETGSRLIATTTAYIGSAWCAGEMTVGGDGEITCDGSATGNQIQTDSLSASLVLYAEQHRNNPNFVCSSDVLSPVAP